MAFTPEQYGQIAAAYEKAATDYMVPPQHRKAFARKAEWFRMLARLGAKQNLLSVPPREERASDSPRTGLQMLSKPVTYLRGSNTLKGASAMKKSSAIFVNAIALGLAMVVPLKASAQGVTIYIGPQGYGAGYPAYAPIPLLWLQLSKLRLCLSKLRLRPSGLRLCLSKLRLRLRPSGLRHLLGPKSTRCSPS